MGPFPEPSNWEPEVSQNDYGPTHVFSPRSAAVLGSSVSSPTPQLFQVSPAPNPAAPVDGRTPLNMHGQTGPFNVAAAGSGFYILLRGEAFRTLTFV